jgi:hypothetical protein
MLAKGEMIAWERLGEIKSKPSHERPIHLRVMLGEDFLQTLAKVSLRESY